MIVPMKKVALIIKGDKKTETLSELRKLGILQIEIHEGSGEKLEKLKAKQAMLENAFFSLQEKKQKKQKIEAVDADVAEAVDIAKTIVSYADEKKAYQAEKAALEVEIERLKSWGEITPHEFDSLVEKGINVLLYEMPVAEYKDFGEQVKILRLEETKTSVKFILFALGAEGEREVIDSINNYRVELPQSSTQELKMKAGELNDRIGLLEEKILSYAGYMDSIKEAIKSCEKEIEFEVFASGMMNEEISADGDLSVACFNGYVEAENVDLLKRKAKENAWGLVVEEPTEEDNVPTKLKNNKFVSLIYPLTDFLNTVPGYYEYDISGWFLGFILIFFGMIFGDGGYGLLILAVAAVPIIKSLAAKKQVSSTMILVGLFGLSTVIWGTLTCTWFGLAPEQLPVWLTKLSIALISNVYEDTIWVPFWMKNGAGLTTAQNLQIFCFILALIQLMIAHVKVAVTCRKSLKILGEIGSMIELTGMFYLVLSFVVSGEVFSMGLVINGIPVGTISIVFIAVGFILNFIFANYEGSIVKSILSSLVNIVSVLLGIFNLFSDIVSYIRLWAVGLAGAAISATVYEMAGPMLGKFTFMIFAIILLVFGHGLNMILNVLSVIVHGVRLNTLEFSNHLGMSWSGYKFKPFEEQK